MVLTLGTPTNATLGANATFTHTIVNDDTALQPAQPTGVYLPQSSSVALDSALLNVYGASEQESVVLAAGASQVELDQNVDRVYLSNSASAYRYQQTGNRINVYAGSEIVLRIPIQSDDDGTVFVFRDGTASALLQSGVMRLGGAVVASAAPASLSPTLGAVVAAPAGPSTASVYLGEHASFAAASAGLNVYGGNGNETLLMREGASAIVADQGIEAVSFGSGLGRYSFQQTGNRLNVYDQAGTLRLLTVTLQGDDDGTQVAFGGVSYSATLSAGVMRIGSWVVASDAPRAITPEIRVSGAGSGNAASADVRFVFSTGSYNYSIVGFGRGDVLDFPDAANPTVNNNSFTDGTVELQWASAGQVIRVTLTGLSATQDQNLNSLTDLTTLFGPGTVI
ncbi:MAG: hypothetical protein EB121_04065 [Alphaproteobacteria bacterium]|nr:hypothetical protein [Alphaproteobacteria bacterium]